MQNELFFQPSMRRRPGRWFQKTQKSRKKRAIPPGRRWSYSLREYDLGSKKPLRGASRGKMQNPAKKTTSPSITALRRPKNGPVKKDCRLGQDNDNKFRRTRTAAPGGGWSRRAELTARSGGLRAALASGRAVDPRGAALLLAPGPAPPQHGLRLQPAADPGGGPERLHPAAQRAEEARARVKWERYGRDR